MTAIESFISRTKEAVSARSKEIRIPITEAEKIVFELAEILLREKLLSDKIITIQSTDAVSRTRILTSLEAESNVVLDGGKF